MTAYMRTLAVSFLVVTLTQLDISLTQTGRLKSIHGSGWLLNGSRKIDDAEIRESGHLGRKCGTGTCFTSWQSLSLRRCKGHDSS